MDRDSSDSASDSPACLKFWGVRGSVPTPGPTTLKYGGNTSCIEVRADGQLIILDGGTGLRLLGRELMSEFDNQSIEVTLLLTHTHWDHIQGLPFFLPVYKEQNRLRILGFEGAKHGLHNILTSQMESPFFPIRLPEVPAIPELPHAPKLSPALPPRPKPPSEERTDLQKAGIAYTLPASLIAPIIVLTIAGYWLDERFHKSPAFTIAGALLGAVSGFINMIRIANKLNE